MGSRGIELWTNQEIALALSLPNEPLMWSATGLSIDTRTLKPGDIYLAIKGDAHDGHQFVNQAFEKGAVAAIVDHKINASANAPQIIVSDTLKALTLLGAFARQRTRATIVAVTGSVGKTSTKELLRHVLQSEGKTFASPASYNNHWGVPLSLATMPRDSQYGIFEIGMNHPGEIAPLASLVCPHIGVITAITDAHIGYMQSRQIIAQEKADIFSAATAPNLAIINLDVPEFDIIFDRISQYGTSQLVGFGKSEKATVRLVDYFPDATGLKGIVTAKMGGQQVTYTLPQAGEHVAMNSLIALAIGEALGLDQSQLIQRLETLPLIQGRGEYHSITIPGGEFLLIDDAYNANLASMQAGLSVLAKIPVFSQGRRLVVLGEMLELGDQAEDQHQKLMSTVLSHPIDLVFASGGPIIEAAFKEYIPPEKAGGYASNSEKLADIVIKAVQPGDILFVKGSKGSRVSKIVDRLILQKNL
ncbi:MAG: UDP-N-acetylmuramoyl-tripeptide--D-alanyl-D-alanine ligase [Alphaproteobacteria bacterium]|nr:UDP-N-acetylmuramoyl-tripeptide--D-alanyl-D-alanine ligase [Alphaproteobacteria bacterium]